MQHNNEYGQLFKGALNNCGILCLGVYRLMNDKQCQDDKRYVVTNPPYNFQINENDKVNISLYMDVSVQ